MRKLSLNGKWDCQWPDGTHFEADVPGCWDSCTDDKALTGPVTYEKKFTVQNEPFDAAIVTFGAVSYACEIFVNGSLAGAHEGLWDSFRVDITPYVRTGENTIKLSIIKPGCEPGDAYPLREVLSGFVQDVLHTFGGIWDDVTLEFVRDFAVSHHYAQGRPDGNFTIHIEAKAINGACPVKADVVVYAPDGSQAAAFSKDIEFCEEAEYTLTGAVPQPELWGLSSPALYRYEINLSSVGRQETVSRRFAFREISSEGSQILLNGIPIYPRGILHWGNYDDILMPNPSKERIFQDLKKIKAMGFNMIKHCLYIPRDAFLDACAEMGVLSWVELPLWIPKVTPALWDRIRREYPAILKYLSGRPSLAFVSLGCELNRGVESAILEEMYHLAGKLTDALVRDNSGSGECYGGLTVDYADFYDYHFYADLTYFEQLCETFSPTWRAKRPWIFGEYCDSDTLRDMALIRERLGVERVDFELYDKKKNPVSHLKDDFFLHLQDERLDESGIRKDWKAALPLSLNHSLTHRKTTIDYTRAFQEITGYVLTSMRDVPIAPHGLFNDFGEPKFDADVFKTFNADTVLVPRWDLTRTWIGGDRVLYKERYNFVSGETYAVRVVLSHYGPAAVNSPRLNWQLLRSGNTAADSGEVRNPEIFQPGCVGEIAYLVFNLPEVTKPETFTLKVSMSADTAAAVNEWPVFVYPASGEINKGFNLGLYDPASLFPDAASEWENVEILADDMSIRDVDMILTTRLSPSVHKFISQGGCGVLVQRGNGVLPIVNVPFWREGMQRPFGHKIMDGLISGHAQDDLRYYSLGTDTALDSRAIEKSALADLTKIEPIIRRYDCRTWKMSDYMAELSIGKGKLIATTLRLEGGSGKQPMLLKRNLLAQWLLRKSFEYLKN